MAPGSNSIVVTAAVEPTTKTVAMPARQFDSATAAATRFVMSFASPCPFVATSRRWVATIGGGRISVPRLAGVAQLVEQLIRNQQVTSSSLVAGSKNPKQFFISDVVAVLASLSGHTGVTPHRVRPVNARPEQQSFDHSNRSSPSARR